MAFRACSIDRASDRQVVVPVEHFLNASAFAAPGLNSSIEYLASGMAMAVSASSEGHDKSAQRVFAEMARACTHLWTPLQVQAVFEEDWHVVGCCHLSGL
jgi:hypothetical protein